MNGVAVHPATPERWPDLVELFERRGPRGGHRNTPAYGCWCMYWRNRALAHGTPKKRAMGTLVCSGREPGVLAYEDGSPVGWASIAPREEFAALLRSPQYRPRDEDEGVWSIVCFTVDKEARGRDISGALLDAAVTHARSRGAASVEGYAHASDARDYMGSRALFLAHGFTPVREAGEAHDRAVGIGPMKRLLWDVDTQIDFMLPHGKLYVPGAEETTSTMARLVSAAREAGIPHVASADDHELTDPEISDEPDFRNTYPPHCLRGTKGAQKIPETEQDDPLPFASLPIPPGLVPGLIEGRREFLLLKKNFDVFTNPNTEALVDALDPEEIILFGVATDVCDDAAIRGLVRRGRRVRFIEDAARGLDESRTAACLATWHEMGVELATAEKVLAGL